MLEHLQAEDDVEARVLDGDRLDRAVEVRVGVPGTVEADDLAGVVEQPLVGPVAAADVEHARSADVLRLEPREERLAHGVLHRGAMRLQAVAHASTTRVAARPKARNVSASSGMPATKPCAVQSQARIAVASRP